jgi:hypothetical protein
VVLQRKRGMERAPSSSASLKRKALIDWVRRSTWPQGILMTFRWI